MEELGVDKKEAKRIIDWINSLVKVTEKDEKDLREEIREELKEEKKKVEKKLEDSPYIFPNNNLNYVDGSTTTFTTAGTTGAMTNAVYCSNTGGIDIQ